MKHERRIPAWLLRDIPALAGMFACFWLFVIPLITEGFRLIRGGKPDPRAFDRLAPLLLNAEATLAFALWREAYRRLGYNPRDVKLSLADLPADNLALMARIRSYMDQVQNLSRASAHYTDILRKRWGASVRVAHGSTDARSAATHEAAGVATSKGLRSAIAVMLSSKQCARPSTCRAEAQRRREHEGGLRCARGPPTFPRRPNATCRLPRWRSPTRSHPRAQSSHASTSEIVTPQAQGVTVQTPSQH